MARVSLTQAAYSARNVIAAAQRCLNLFPEKNPVGEDSPTTLYLASGLSRLGRPPETATVRGLYRATTGDLYAAVGSGIYYIAPDWSATLIGTTAVNTTPVKFNDNGIVMVIVDGSAFGWVVNLTTRGYAAISDPNFFGSNFVEFLDTFLLFNKPGTNIWYCSPSNYNGSASGTDLVIGAANSVTSASYTFTTFDVGHTITIASGVGFTPGVYTVLSAAAGAATLDSSPGTITSSGGVWSEGTPFDPLFFAAKVGYSDNVSAIAVQNRNIWIVGTQATSEIWFDAGAADFPFQIMPGPFVEHGSSAQYSIAKQGGSVFWLAQDPAGASYVVEASGFSVVKISTPALEAAIGSYPIVSDAVGFCYEQLGHGFYWLKFISQGVDWVYDLSTKLWHERSWLNPATCEAESHRAFCQAFCYGVNVVGDRQTGQLYMLDPNNPTDAGDFIERRRGYPHLMADGARASFPMFEADMQTGTAQPQTAAGLPQGLASSLTFPATVTVIDTTFAAPNGTLLQNYAIPYGLVDTGSQYTQIDATTDLEVENQLATGVGTGTTSYVASGVATSADYIAQFRAVPDVDGGISATGTQVYLIGRADASNNGYQLAVNSNGLVYRLVLTVMGAGSTTVVMGLTSSLDFHVFLSMQGTAIDGAVQRSVDGMWLAPSGLWQADFVPAISITDGTYALRGDVIIGGTWA